MAKKVDDGDNDAREIVKQVKADEPWRKVPEKHYDDYIKDADPVTPRGGQERRT